MKCPKCGNDVLSSDSHCGSCGVHLATAFKEKQASKPAASKPSPTPQTKQTGLVCPKCGHPVKSTDIACGYCAATLVPVVSSSTRTTDNVYSVLALIFSLFGSPIIALILGILGWRKSNDCEGKGGLLSFIAIIISLICIVYLFVVAKNIELFFEQLFNHIM